MSVITDLDCAYCTSLPAFRSRRAGRVSRCPLCKGELIFAHDSATAYRLEAGTGATTGRRPRVLALGGLALAVGLLGTLAFFAAGRFGQQSNHAALQARLTEARLALSQQEQAEDDLTEPSGLDPEDLLSGLPATAAESSPAAPLPVPPPPLSGQTFVSVAASPAHLWPLPPTLPRPFVVSGIRLATVLGEPRSKYASEEDLRVTLRQVPEVDLQTSLAGLSSSGIGPREAIGAKVLEIQQLTVKDQDGFVRNLQKTREDLAGLSLRMRKDCTLDEERAFSLGRESRRIRGLLDNISYMEKASFASRSRPTFSSASAGGKSEMDFAADRFWASLERRSGYPPSEGEMTIPALVQLLQAEPSPMRLPLVSYVQKAKGKEASVVLARLAVFDLDARVRTEARQALKQQPAEHYSAVLLEGLRYPWLPAAEHAAEALAELKPRDTIRELVRLLDEPDPDAPFLKEVNGKEVPVVRELVRVNHLRNCLLCHAPSHERQDLVRGVIPVPGEALPPSLTAYYSGNRDAIFVRADVTYLRQDFSVMQPVADQHPWPDKQRYDYVVRTRPLANDERDDWEARREAGLQFDSPYRRAVLQALCGVTGEYLGESSTAWRHLLRN